MIFSKRLFFLFVFLVPVLSPSLSYSEVQVLLKNGRDIIADSCQEEDGKFICYKAGGSFEVEKEAVAAIKGITSRRREDGLSETSVPEPENKKQPSENTASPPEGDKKAEDEKPFKTGEDSKARIESIAKRKSELGLERENLVRDRQRLQDDVKNKPDWMTVKEFDDINKRISELDERINRFNEEVNRLNQEEKRIIEEFRGKTD